MPSVMRRADDDDRFFVTDELIGLMSSLNLSRTGETGYTLLFTKNRVVGARRPESEPDHLVYLGPGSQATEAERSSSAVAAARLIQGKQFVLEKESVAQILYRPPGLLSSGSVVFKTPLQSFKVEIPVVSGWNDWPARASEVLIRCLMAFSPGRVYDGKTGALYAEERLKTGHH